MKHEEHKIETDELITLYLDGEATVRQQTELKRLMQHDPLLVERIDALRRQQQMLNALAVETAPEGLVENILVEMERKQILSDFPETSPSVLKAGSLFVRRLLTAAAMIFLPLGLLAALIFQIVKPPASESLESVSRYHAIVPEENRVNPLTSEPAIFRALPFHGVLVLKTDDYNGTQKQVKETIEALGLLGQTFPDRTVDTTCFHVTASAQKIAELVDSLEAVRPQCGSVTLQVADVPADQFIEIAEPQAKQIKTLVYEDSPEMLQRLARRYASVNQKNDSMLAASSERLDLAADGYPEPSIPTLAGAYDRANQTARFTIQVERSED